jgi:hypothetical protein
MRRLSERLSPFTRQVILMLTLKPDDFLFLPTNEGKHEYIYHEVLGRFVPHGMWTITHVGHVIGGSRMNGQMATPDNVTSTRVLPYLDRFYLRHQFNKWATRAVDIDGAQAVLKAGLSPKVTPVTAGAGMSATSMAVQAQQAQGKLNAEQVRLLNEMEDKLTRAMKENAAKLKPVTFEDVAREFNGGNITLLNEMEALRRDMTQLDAIKYTLAERIVSPPVMFKPGPLV